MSKIEELKKLVRTWKQDKSLTLAYDICEYLANNLDLNETKKELTVEEFNQLPDALKKHIFDKWRKERK